MTAVLVVSCDGTWDDGRMPCRGALPVHREALLLEALRAEALAAGWSLTKDGDLCPAHARRAQEAGA